MEVYARVDNDEPITLFWELLEPSRIYAYNPALNNDPKLRF